MARQARVTTGIPGLDDVLHGGFTPDRLYLVEGDPGSGKTTLALQFLLGGARRGERGLYITLSETKEELEGVARSHGWSLDAIDVTELIASEESLLPDAQTRMFHPSEVELGQTTRTVLSEVERINPTRVVFDSLSEMRLLAQNPLHYRRQILAIKQFFRNRSSTILLLDDKTSEPYDLQLQSLAHGVLSLEHLAQEYGSERRRLRIIKMRGQQFRGGYHDFRIITGGLEVYPRLVAAEHVTSGDRSDLLTSGIPEVDKLLGGGLNRGTSVLLLGPAGSGKSSLALRYAVEAASRGECASLFLFDESIRTLSVRAEGLGINLAGAIESGRIFVRQIDPAELSPGEFSQSVRYDVEERGARIVVIDSLNGYMTAMPEERFLTLHLHELLMFLGQKGVVTFLIVAQHGLIGNAVQSPIDASYLADSVILIRFYEYNGALRRAISVLKKRSGAHEDTLREMTMSGRGIHVGEPLSNLQGVMTGVPMSIERIASRLDRDDHG